MTHHGKESALERLVGNVWSGDMAGFCRVKIDDLLLLLTALNAARAMKPNWKNGGVMMRTDDFHDAITALESK